MALAEPAADTPEVLAAQARWRPAMEAFASQDREHPPESGGVLFVGSSTIRMWSRLAQDFRQWPVVMNRGFGGSTMADCSLLAHQFVIQYKPRQVLVYAGDNDLAEGRSPAQVLESFEAFARTVRAELPGVRLAYISIKPSPARAALLPRIRETNTLIAHYLLTLPNTQYIDIYTAMLDDAGQPRRELFLPDGLHMKEQGYAVWQPVIAGSLQAQQ
ncbi:MAG TPA: SGNH/GDSL hydrolase family protein [Burkholderiaceae bacterium]